MKNSLGQKKSKFQNHLQGEFLRRCKHNERYSMRAFAVFLDVDQSLLSKILRGKRPITDALARKFAKKLSLPEAIVTQFADDLKGHGTFNPVEDDVFNVIGEWHHFAILELLKTDNVRHDARWLAGRLGLSAAEIKKALIRLERVGLLEMNDAKWTLLSPNQSWTNFESSSIARKNLQRELIQKSLQAIDGVDFSLRENASLTVACDEALLPEIKAKLQSYRKELDAFIEARGSKKQVYQLVMSFYPLTALEGSHEN